MQLFLFRGINFLRIAITITFSIPHPTWFSRNVTVLGKKPSDYNYISEFQEELILHKLHLQLHFQSVWNLHRNHFGADSTLPHFIFQDLSVIITPPTAPNNLRGFNKRTSQGKLHHLVLFLLGKITPSFTPKHSQGINCRNKFHPVIPEHSWGINCVILEGPMVLFKAQLGEPFPRKFDLFFFVFWGVSKPALKSPKPALKSPKLALKRAKPALKRPNRHLKNEQSLKDKTSQFRNGYGKAKGALQRAPKKGADTISWLCVLCEVRNEDVCEDNQSLA